MATKIETPPKTEDKPPELVKLAEGVSEALFGEKKKDDKKPKAAPAAAEAVAAPGAASTDTPPKPSETAPAPTKPAAAPATAAPAKPKAEPSVDERIQATARRTADEVVKAMREGEQPPEQPPTAEPELTPEDLADYKAFQKLETMNSKRKGIADRFVEFVKARGEYEENWLKENEGKEFDPDAEEHKDFWKEWKEFDSPTVADELENAKIGECASMTGLNSGCGPSRTPTGAGLLCSNFNLLSPSR